MCSLIMLFLLSDIPFLWYRLHSVVPQPQFIIKPNIIHNPQQRANWKEAKLLYIALQFTLMKWPQKKADLLSFFLLDSASTVHTDIYLLLYLQHVNQGHLISEKAYNYALACSPTFLYPICVSSISKKRGKEAQKKRDK